MTKPAPKPCGSCPYRKDVPSGIWDKSEYDKLPEYDAPMPFQPQGLFMCHQRDGHLCSGWLACHGGGNLLSVRIAIRVTGDMDQSVEHYTTDVPLFSSGQEARDHGVREIEKPNAKAKKMVAGLLKNRESEGHREPRQQFGTARARTK